MTYYSITKASVQMNTKEEGRHWTVWTEQWSTNYFCVLIPWTHEYIQLDFGKEGFADVRKTRSLWWGSFIVQVIPVQSWQSLK